MKKQKGITLISLVVTIIVLLILAGVTLTMLSGENGIMTRAKTARDQHETGQEEETNKLAGMENVMDQYLGATTGGGNAITDTDGNPITIADLDAGDDIKIGTEQFKVFKADPSSVYAMPYYNITLTETPEQNASAGTIAFADGGNNYWPGATNEIDMTVKKEDGVTYKNNIQQYIEAYSSKLHALDSRVTARAGRDNELNETGVTNAMRNPGQTGTFWLGSAMSNSSVRIVVGDGCLSGNYYYSLYGVRPVIIISKS